MRELSPYMPSQGIKDKRQEINRPAQANIFLTYNSTSVIVQLAQLTEDMVYMQ